MFFILINDKHRVIFVVEKTLTLYHAHVVVIWGSVLVSFSVEGPSPKLFCDFALLRNSTGTVTNYNG